LDAVGGDLAPKILELIKGPATMIAYGGLDQH